MYYFPQPPFLVICLGLFIGVTCGLTFQTQIKQRVTAWSKNRSEQNLFPLEGANLKLTYWGICLGIWMFLGGGLLVFGFGLISAFGVTLPLTIFTGGLIWTQLKDVLLQLQKGGSQALDFKIFN